MVQSLKLQLYQNRSSFDYNSKKSFTLLETAFKLIEAFLINKKVFEQSFNFPKFQDKKENKFEIR